VRRGWFLGMFHFCLPPAATEKEIYDSLARIVFVLSHGQSKVERGLNVEKDALVNKKLLQRHCI